MRFRKACPPRALSGLLTRTLVAAGTLALGTAHLVQAQSLDPRPPAGPVRLVFIHHSCGENWLSDADGGLARALAENHYFVSDTNYGWGPNGIGDRTDITDWPEWFTGPQSGRYLRALYKESERHSDYARSLSAPGGENRVVLFKSCFPNSNLEGRPADPPARGDGLTVANAKAIYRELLRYFATRPDKLFVAITAPPVQDPAHSANARAFNTWLVRDWLSGYRGNNVAVFDFYNVLTGPRNHHRFRNGRIEYVSDAGRNTLYYPTGDDHPSRTGNRKATEEFVSLLNVYYHRWIATAPPSEPRIETPPRVTTVEPEPEPGRPVPAPTSQPTPGMPQPAAERRVTPAGLVDDFEGEVDAWAAFLGEAEGTRLSFKRDQAVKHGGSASLEVRYDLPRESWATCSLVHDEPRDWSRFQGLSLYLHTEKPGQTVTVVAYGGRSADDLIHFEHRLEAGPAAVSGWQRLDLRWDQLKLPAWQDDGNRRFDPRSAMGFALAFESAEGPRAGRLWIDDVTLLSAAMPNRER